LINGEIQLKHSPFSGPKHVEHGYSHPKIYYFFVKIKINKINKKKKKKVKTLANVIYIRIITI